MAQTVLGNISLGYQLLWSPLRQPAAVQLFVNADAEVPVDAHHLLAALGELWPESAPPLLLALQSHPLLLDLLDHAGPAGPWLQIDEAWLEQPELARRVHQAQQRGLPLVWHGEPGQRPGPALGHDCHKCIIHLTADEALQGLRASLHRQRDLEGTARPASPVTAGQIYAGVASRALAEHCLDQQDAWALTTWPVEDVLHGYRQQPIPPDQTTLTRLIEAIDADASLDAIERLLSEEPVLAWRFLRYINSPGLGLRSEVESIRRGLMVLGYSVLRTWLAEQQPQATADRNLQPIRTALVMRAHLMERLLDAGEEDNLRREVYLCGLLSQVDLLLGEPLATALAHLPLPERITDALLLHSGPYAPYIEIAAALASPDTHATHALCDAHQIGLEEVNRALLRTLALLQARPAKGLPA
jgi:EAL and modified HD-GYP domain-containing signal transduction protein